MERDLSSPGPIAPLWLLIALQTGVSGASLVVEIVAGRMIAPYVGMSLYSWTAIIAVVLAGFSVGHWWGGRIAALGSAAALRWTGWTLVAAAATTAGASLLLRATAGPVLNAISEPVSAIVALTTVVFFLPSLFAGVPAPVLSVAAMRGRDGAERALGGMFAAGAMGAIIGTLLAGFVLVPLLGSIQTLIAISVVYAVAAMVCFAIGRQDRRGRWSGLVSVTGVLGLALGSLGLSPVCDRESGYYCIRTVALSGAAEAPVNLMVLDHLAHGVSARDAPRVMYTDHTAMLDALARMRMGRLDFTSFHIGGGSYSVPRAWSDRGIKGITVAEIDPEVTRHAVRDFWFSPDDASVLHGDARALLRRDARRYDVIVGDAFTDIAVPAHLVTREFFGLVADRLRPGGVFVMNLLDNTDRLDALAAIVATLGTAFSSVEVWTEARPPMPAERRVFVLVAAQSESPVSQITTRAPEETRFAVLDARFIDELIAERAPRILTDDRAPIALLMGFDRLLD